MTYDLIRALVDALAGDDSDHRSGAHKDDRLWRRTIDSDGASVVVLCPPVRRLARALVPLLFPGSELYQRHAALTARPIGSAAEPAPVDVADAGARLTEILRKLPALDGTAGRSYTDLCRLVAEAHPTTVAEYVRAVLARVRLDAPAAPRAPRTIAGPAALSVTDPAAYAREKRATDRAATLDAARAKVHGWAAKHAPGRHAFGDLWARWRAQIAALSPEKRAANARALALGKHGFFELLRELPNVIIRENVRYLVIKEPSVVDLDRLREEAAAAREAAAALNEYTAAHERAARAQADPVPALALLASTGTESARVIDIAARRATR